MTTKDVQIGKNYTTIIRLPIVGRFSTTVKILSINANGGWNARCSRTKMTVHIRSAKGLAEAD